MSHDERLPECKEFQCSLKASMDKHIDESVPVRRDVDVNKSQIDTLKQSQASIMQDIKDIKEDISLIRSDVLGLKIWILGGILSIAVAFAIPMFQLMSSMGEAKEKVYRLEKLHPYGSALSTQGVKE